MAFLRDIFEKSKTAPLGSPRQMPIPTEQVSKLRQQGLNNDQIIQTLQRNGYTLDVINHAINIVDAKEGVEGIVVTGVNPMEETGFPKESPAFDMPPMEPPREMGEMGPSMATPTASFQEVSPAQEEKLQEIAEAIIEEKWNELIKNVNRVVEWKNTMEGRITKIEEALKQLNDSFEKLHMGVLEKIGNYDQSIKDVSTEIRALEKVFQKILPGFVENVNELSRIAQTLKGKK